MFKQMKKVTFFACAAMLASVALTGCSGNDANVPANAPQVTTDIAIALPSQVGGPKRMPGATVQTAGATDFTANGMDLITLVPFGPSATVTTSSVRIGENIVLGQIGATQAYAADANAKAKVFTGKSVPQGTSAFLFYGVSGKTGTDFEKGALTQSLSGEPTAFTFTLKKINSNASDITSNAAYTGLIAYLNAVANANDGVKAWKNYESTDNEGLYELFQTYKTAKTLTSYGVRRMMEDLYKSLMPSSDAMSEAIKTAIADATYATVNTTTGEVTLVAGLQGFPASLNLPDGVIGVAYDAGAGAFDGNAAHAYAGLELAPVDRYVYPAQLWYYANSRIKTSTTTKESEYTGADDWTAILGEYEKDNSSVNTKTRSVAIKNPVQYGVARLDVKVKTKEGTTLEDNNPVPTAKYIDNPALGWPLTAVLVGGQKHVGFDFTPGTYAGGDANAYIIYDKTMSSTIYAVTADYSAANSTLVLETAADENEYIALEFENTSDKDFYGYDGIVPVGAKFYLVGQLTATSATETGNKVFKQDYTTTARVAIKDLKNAYSTIPDLRAPSLEIGLSIDLEWQAGHTYDLEL
jgi:hypothetical protein